MIRVLVCCALTLAAAGSAACDELLFYDDFSDGMMDGWHHFSTHFAGYAFWIQDGEMWGRSSDGTDCCECSGCNGLALIDDLTVEDVSFECKITNRNTCGLIHIRLRLSEDWFSSDEGVRFWHVSFDPGTNFYSLGAKDGTTFLDGTVTGSFNFGTGVPQYFRVVLSGQTIELWRSATGWRDYQLLDSTTCPDAVADPGHIGVKVGSAAKKASFDDVAVYRPGTPVEASSWGTIKALYGECLPN